jgi:Zn-dependent peptidase ImmA (M78 family)/transcriptional regulator with XRE-family HTH domain
MNHDPRDLLNPRILGKRLQEARKLRGYTQQQAGELLDLARTTLVAIEKGERRVRPDELTAIAALYGRSVGELVRQSEPVHAFDVQFREGPGIRGVDYEEIAAARLEFHRLCEDYLELERICNAPVSRRYPPEYQVGRLSAEADAHDVASAERNRLGLGDAPILHLREMLEEDVGIRIFSIDMPSRVAAMFAYTEELGGCIAVNRKHPEERRRMSLGHDYGHFLSSRYRPVLDLIGHHQRVPEHERFAEAFARSFLLPESGLARRFNDLRRRQDGKVTPADLCRLAHLYFVSLEALVLRLEELRLLRTGTWNRLRDAGFRVREAQELLEFPPHPTADEMLPRRYRYLAVAAFQNGQLSEGQLARFLRVDRLEARRTVEELSTYWHVSEDGTVHVERFDLDQPLVAGLE